MIADDKWVDKHDPTTQELEGVSWNNCEEHLNMKNYGINFFKKHVIERCHFLLCDFRETQSVTSSRKVRQRSWKSHLWMLIKLCDYCTADSQEITPGQGAVDAVTSVLLSLTFGGGQQLWTCLANLWSHWVVAVTHQLYRDQEGNTCCAAGEDVTEAQMNYAGARLQPQQLRCQWS